MSILINKGMKHEPSLVVSSNVLKLDWLTGNGGIQ